jgi:lipoprotein antigen
MDFFTNGVALSIHIEGGHPDLYEYEQGRNGQDAVAKRDGNTVKVTGTIGVALDDTTPPARFSITAKCGKFVTTPPGSSSVG